MSPQSTMISPMTYRTLIMPNGVPVLEGNQSAPDGQHEEPGNILDYDLDNE